MQRAGVIPLLAKLLKSSNESMLIPIGGIIEECATDVGHLCSSLLHEESLLDLAGLSSGDSRNDQRSGEESSQCQ